MRFRFLILFLLGVCSSHAVSRVTFRNVGTVGFGTSGATNYWRYAHNGTPVNLGSPVLLPGQSSAAYDVTSWVGQTVQVQTSSPNSGTMTNWSRVDLGYPGTWTVLANTDWVIEFFMGNSPTQICTVTICVKNNDTRWHSYTLWRGGQEYGATGGGSTTVFDDTALHLEPGQEGCTIFEVDCAYSTGWSLQYWSGENLVGNSVTNYAVATNNPASPNYPSQTNSVTPQGPTTYTPGNGSTSNILWSADSQTNAIVSQQIGDSALYDAITKGAEGNDKNLRNVVSNLAGIHETLSQGFGISNGLAGLAAALEGGFGTNNFGETGVVAAVRSFHVDNTNWLATIANIMTNGGDGISAITNYYNSTQGIAEEAGEGVVSDLSTFTGLVESLTAVPAFSGVSDTFWTLTFMGETMNFNPYSHFPDLFDFSRRLIAWILALAYVTKVVKETFKVVEVVGAATQMQLPSLEATFAGAGGNFAILLWPVIVGTFLVALGIFISAIMVGLATWITGDTISYFTTLPWASGSPSVLAGVQLLSAAVPLNLVAGFIFSYLVWRSIMIKAGIIFVIWVKIMMG